MFNWVGYRFLTSYLENKSNLALNAQLDADNYNEADLISIKVANNLPYTNAKKFERVNGQIEIGGVQYNYVKIKVSSDSLELLCIPNHDVTNLKASKAEFFKLVNDLQPNGQGKKGESNSGASKSFSPDTYAVNELFTLHHPAAMAEVDMFGEYAFFIPAGNAPTAERPPQLS